MTDKEIYEEELRVYSNFRCKGVYRCKLANEFDADVSSLLDSLGDDND